MTDSMFGMHYQRYRSTTRKQSCQEKKKGLINRCFASVNTKNKWIQSVADTVTKLVKRYG